MRRWKNILHDYLKIAIEDKSSHDGLYDAKYADGIERFSQKPRWKEEARFALGELSLEPESRCLDVGCNAGVGTKHLSELAGTPFVGVDISEPAVARAQERFPNGENEFVVYDGYTLPFDSESFDLIVCMHVIGHVDDPVSFVSEMHRVLRPDGRLLLVTPSAVYKAFALLDTIVTHYAPDMTIRRYYSHRRLHSLLRKCGFKRIQIKSYGERPILLRKFPLGGFGRMRLVAVAQKNWRTNC